MRARFVGIKGVVTVRSWTVKVRSEGRVYSSGRAFRVLGGKESGAKSSEFG
jgi:hypothetical protein